MMIRIHYNNDLQKKVEEIFKNKVISFLSAEKDDVILINQLNDELGKWSIKRENGSSYQIEDFILMPYQDIKALKDRIDRLGKKVEMDKECWTKYTDLYDIVRKTQHKHKKMSAWIVEFFGLKTCPYCNRAFIDNREIEMGNWTKVESVAQLDHFYPKAKYPCFALSLYNYVPCC